MVLWQHAALRLLTARSAQSLATPATQFKARAVSALLVLYLAASNCVLVTPVLLYLPRLLTELWALVNVRFLMARAARSAAMLDTLSAVMLDAVWLARSWVLNKPVLATLAPL